MMIYTRDLAPGHSAAELVAEHAHVRAQLSAVADADDNPDAYADDVEVRHESLADGGLRIVGTLDAEPVAPYLRADHDPFDGVDADLLREVLGG